MKWSRRTWLWIASPLLVAALLLAFWPLSDPIKWTFPLRPNDFNVPVVAPDGTIYVGDIQGQLFAVNPDGTQKWSTQLALGLITEPAIGPDGSLYVPLFVSGRAGGLTCVSPEGAIKWEFKQCGPVRGAPVIGTDGTIYVGGYNSNFFALNPDGTVRWQFATNEAIDRSPVFTHRDGIAFVTRDTDFLYVLEPDGQPRTVNMLYEGRFISSVAAAPDGGLLASSGSQLRLLSADGSVKWTTGTSNFPAPAGMAAPAGHIVGTPQMLADGSVYVHTTSGSVVKLDPTGKAVFAIEAGESHDAAHEALLATAGDKLLLVFEKTLQVAVGTNGTYRLCTQEAAIIQLAGDGKEQWRVPIPGKLNPFRLLDFSNFADNKLLGFGRLDYQGLSKPAVGPDGTIYVRCERGLLAIQPPER